MDQSNQYDPNNPNDPNNPVSPNGIDMSNADTIRQTSPDTTIRETQGGQTLDPNNNVADLPDGRQVEVPPSNLAAAKDTLAAQRATERDLAQNATDPSSTGVVGAPSGTGMGVTGVSGMPSGTGAGATGIAGSSSSYDPVSQRATNDPTYDTTGQGINTQGYDTTNQGMGSQAYNPNNPNDPSQTYDPNQTTASQGSMQSYDPNQPNQGSQSYDPNQASQSSGSGMSGAGYDQGFDPNRGMTGQTGDQNYDPNQGLTGQTGSQQGYGAGGQGYGGANTDNVNDQPYPGSTDRSNDPLP